MNQLTPHYIVDEGNNRTSVVLPIDQWEEILEELEELDAIREYDEAKAAGGEAIPFETAVKEIREKYEA